jgi:short-subunit dehydrogenase
MPEQYTERPIAVVTGATSGFGEEIFRRLAVSYMPIAIARREDRLIDLTEEAGGEYYVCDISNPGNVEAVASHILDQHPAINVLVNNAGMGLRYRFDDVDSEKAKEVMATNYMGTFLLTRALMPGLEEAAPDADIINIVSAAAGITNPHSGPYGASKAAQLAYSRSLMTDLAPRGIRVHTINPSKANTEGHPQSDSHSLLSRVTHTDIGSVATATLDRIGKKPREVYVPRIGKLLAVAQVVAPISTTRLVDRVLS